MRHFHLVFILIFGLLIAGCSTMAGVRVERASHIAMPMETRINVVGDDSGSVWATQDALRRQGWPIGDQGRPDSWVLRTYTTVSTEIRSQPDPFCEPYGWRPQGWFPGSRWGGFYGPRQLPQDRWQAYRVRTLSWALEDEQGRVVWYASARENRPGGPPLALADRLARALVQWREQNLATDPGVAPR